MIPEKNDLLDSMTKYLNASKCAVGWNADFHNWDMKIRRGVFGEAILRLAIEYHGGPKRLARFAATIRPSRSVYWFQIMSAILLGVSGTLGFYSAFIMALLLFSILWIAPIIEANRIEETLAAATNDVISSALTNIPDKPSEAEQIE
jgi:hypothetical protein